jgi:hypothetical protein
VSRLEWRLACFGSAVVGGWAGVLLMGALCANSVRRAYTDGCLDTLERRDGELAELLRESVEVEPDRVPRRPFSLDS